MEARFETSTKGRPMLVFNDNKYTHYNTNNLTVSRWRCVKYGHECRAQLQTFDSKVIGNISPLHRHRSASSVSSRPVATNAVRNKDVNQKIAILKKLIEESGNVASESSDEENQSIETSPSSEEMNNLPRKPAKRNIKWDKW